MDEIKGITSLVLGSLSLVGLGVCFWRYHKRHKIETSLTFSAKAHKDFENFFTESDFDNLNTKASELIRDKLPEGCTLLGIYHSWDQIRNLNKHSITFSPETLEKLKEGAAIFIEKADGSKLAIAQDVATGKIIENGTIVSKLSLDWVAVGASLLAVSHIISNIDLNRKIDLIKARLDKVLFRQFNGLISELEAIFETVSSATQEKNTSQTQTLSDCQYRLRKLRSQTARELQKYLADFKNPKKRRFYERLFSWQDRGIERELNEKLMEYDSFLRLLSKSLKLEHKIAQLNGGLLVIENIENQIEKVYIEFKKHIDAHEAIGSSAKADQLKLVWFQHFGNTPEDQNQQEISKDLDVETPLLLNDKN